MKVEKINLTEKFQHIIACWEPKIAGALNGQHVKLAKFKGRFVRHCHPTADELFLVVKGTINIKLDDEVITLNEGEMTIIPKGVPHQPMAVEEAHVLMFEPAGTLNTGDKQNANTIDNQGWI